MIVDEVHAVARRSAAPTWRSAWSGSTAAARPAQRIGLSATVRPLEEVARFLGGGREVTVVQPPAQKPVDLRVVVPVEDMSSSASRRVRCAGRRPGPTPDIDLAACRGAGARPVEQHRSTIVFANSRRLAERLSARLNELASERLYGQTA